MEEEEEKEEEEEEAAPLDVMKARPPSSLQHCGFLHLLCLSREKFMSILSIVKMKNHNNLMLQA